MNGLLSCSASYASICLQGSRIPQQITCLEERSQNQDTKSSSYKIGRGPCKFEEYKQYLVS